VPHSLHDEPEGKARRSAASPIRSPIRISPSRRCWMAGLDGIKDKLHPGEARRQGPLRSAAEGVKEDSDRLRSLRQALEEINKDAASSRPAGVFDDDFIDAYVDLKMAEIIRFRSTPRIRSSRNVLLGVRRWRERWR